MSRTAKKPKYQQFEQFENTYVFDEQTSKVAYFSDNQPITLELGCGKAEPTLYFAKKYPSRNFIGIDVKADRLWKPAKLAQESDLTNVVFVKMHLRFLAQAFNKNSVDEMWLTFSDPYPKSRQEKHRLTHPKFLQIYKEILRPGSKIYFKTDERDFFEWSLAQFAHDRQITIEDMSFDLHSNNDIEEDSKVATYYEQIFIEEGKKINYCQLSF